MTGAGIITDRDFPHGLRCIRCDDIMVDGTAYCAVPLTDDISEIVCPACAIQP